jgi:hypothetical protein
MPLGSKEPLPPGNSPLRPRKQSISGPIVSFCVSFCSYMLDVVAISVDLSPGGGAGEGGLK